VNKDKFRRAMTSNGLARRIYILSLTFLDHRFERQATIPALSESELAELYRSDLTFPPRKDLMLPGMQTIEGLFALGSLAALKPASTIFEIGTFRGVTAWFFAQNRPDASVHTLDLPPNTSAKLELESSDEFRATEDMYYLLRSGPPNIVQHWGDSASFDFSPWDHSCDLIYIDGAHSEPYVRSDTENALKMISSDGVIVWDDYWRESPGTISVLDRLHGDGLRLRRVPGTRLVIHTDLI
jgi:hypothetical protein